MSRVVALIDGEHYPPVVRFALEQLAGDHEVVAAAFLGGTEKVDLDSENEAYGVPLVSAETAEAAVASAIEHYGPDLVADLSDEPVVTSADRFRLAGVALSHGVEYRGADFHFSPPTVALRTVTPTLGLIGTGKRVGKTAISAYVARLLKARGRDIVVLAMGRGGPAEPELIRGDEVALTTPDLLDLARQGKHASSDNYEDAVMSRVTTVGCRRCGGGMAGETYFSNVPAGARLADTLGKELLVLEGSGAAIPPVHADASVLVVGAGQGLTYVRDYFGPFRLGKADAVVLATAEEPNATAEEIAAIRGAIDEVRPGIPVVATTFRPAPIEPVEGARVFFATTAPEAVLDKLSAHLEHKHGCTVVAASSHLSNRSLLRRDMVAASGAYDLLLTELKAAAIDVVATAGEEAGVPTVFCDNVPVSVDGGDLDGLLVEASRLALERGAGRGA
ncbi:MAG: 2,3-diphosphoglycerate synthetase [Coriobacteriia bacterium]|nr:2,3-diphosphoglycerate synthetase [Coriobacteriia bacterium]